MYSLKGNVASSLGCRTLGSHAASSVSRSGALAVTSNGQCSPAGWQDVGPTNRSKGRPPPLPGALSTASNQLTSHYYRRYLSSLPWSTEKLSSTHHQNARTPADRLTLAHNAATYLVRLQLNPPDLHQQPDPLLTTSLGYYGPPTAAKPTSPASTSRSSGRLPQSLTTTHGSDSQSTRIPSQPLSSPRAESGSQKKKQP